MTYQKIKVPATTANLGPGFDIIGVSLNLYNEIEFKVSEELIISSEGNYYDSNIPKDEKHLIYQSIKHVFDSLNKPTPLLDIKVKVNIPLSRGLGSSSTCIVSGVYIANLLLDNCFSFSELLNFANQIEGHPDNVAPCLYGGILVSSIENNQVITQSIKTDLPLKFVVSIPDFKLSTKEAREVLPKQIPFSDAIYNLSKMTFLISALYEGSIDKLAISLEDKMHQPYRGKLIPEFENIKKLSISKGAIGTVISGAGPTILSICLDDPELVASNIKSHWQDFGIDSNYKILDIDSKGTHVSE